eukprot:scaffold40924_cov34-Attheya_sp.AAC.1
MDGEKELTTYNQDKLDRAMKREHLLNLLRTWRQQRESESEKGKECLEGKDNEIERDLSKRERSVCTGKRGVNES